MEQLIIIGVLGSIGYFWGSRAEKKHYASIEERESKLMNVAAINFKTAPYKNDEIVDQTLVSGSVVISIDYFKQFMASLKMLVGGRLTSYESLVDRARRESILRMKEKSLGFDMIINVRVETSTISKGAKNAVGSIEVLAYGTAIKLNEAHS